jgi:hypothetical protein
VAHSRTSVVAQRGLVCLRQCISIFLFAAFWAAWCPAAQAQGNLESVLAPGKLSQSHAKFDEECQKCHVRFDRNAQDRLCADCHKDVGQDLRSKTGLHGRMTAQACKTCHTEHKGRDFQIAAFDKQKFDHATTNFALRGGHTKVECAKCHLPGGDKKTYRIAAHDCVACHKKDDKHKGSLGPQCADCHTEVNWKDAKFDHSKTHFPLLGKHDSVKCEECHKNGQYKDTPQACVACHKKDDKHKTQFGDRCDTCHTASDWKTIKFNHDTDTHYALLGKHRAVKCESCHTGNLYKDKLASNCFACHKKDDKHLGSLGENCAACHTERAWKEPAKFDHAKTVFPLLGKHADVQCADCHKDTMFKEAPKTCIGCHKKDDKHKGTLGDSCDTCHNARDWKKTSFDHAKTSFPLMGKHATTQCNACHKTFNYKEAAKDCFSCHQKDDKHQGQEGRGCERCHDARAWKPAPSFDHGLTRFPLLGNHAKVECKSCHTSVQFKNASIACYSCHVKDDAHKKLLGTLCEQCHNARNWKAWDFDHDKRTKFPLDGKHTGLACKACHVRPMEGRVVASGQCVSCHAKDDVHDGSYGKTCQQCHVTSSFRTIKSRGANKIGMADPGTIVHHPSTRQEPAADSAS